MTQFVVNLVLIVAVLVLLAAWALSASRHRRRDRREHAVERRLILSALTHAAGVPTVPAEPAEGTQPTNGCGSDSQRAPAAAPERLDAASVAALLELLKNRRPAARGVLASLVVSPRTVWSAGARAGQTLGQRTTASQRDDCTEQ